MDVLINQNKSKRRITAPPSKSYEQRLLAAALLSGEDCILSGFGSSMDVLAARQIISALGSDVILNEKQLVVSKRKIMPENYVPVLNCGESGLCARLFPPIAAVLFKSFVVEAEESLQKRNVVKDYDVLKEFGCEFKTTNGNFPVKFFNSKINAGKYTLDGSHSSQHISGLVIALGFLENNSNIHVQNPVSTNYILMSLEVLRKFGICLEVIDENRKKLVIDLNKSLSDTSAFEKRTANLELLSVPQFDVEGDWSGVSNILVAAAINGNVEVMGLATESLQADKAILDVFQMAEVKFNWQKNVLHCTKSKIKAFKFDATDCPDLIPAIIILAVFADGVSTIKGMNRVIHKESSRAEVMQKELQKAGVSLDLKNDEMIIRGNQKPHSAILNAHADHRMVMAFAVLGLNTYGGVTIKGAECVSKSWPDFFDSILNVF